MKKSLAIVLVSILLLTGCAPISGESDGGTEMQWYKVTAPEDGTNNFYGVLEQLETEGMSSGDTYMKYLKFGSLDEAVSFLQAFLVDPQLPETLAAPGEVLLVYVTSGEGDTFRVTENIQEDGAHISVIRKEYTGIRNDIAYMELYILPLTPGVHLADFTAKTE